MRGSLQLAGRWARLGERRKEIGGEVDVRKIDDGEEGGFE